MNSRFLTGSLFLLLLSAAMPADSQVPPHRPGTICYTPYRWCPLRNQLPVGAACGCRNGNTVVQGKAG